MVKLKNKIIVILLLITSISLSQENTIFYDNFDSKTSKWILNNDCYLEKSRLIIKSSAEEFLKIIYTQIFIDYRKNFSIEIKIKQNKGTKTQGYGIIWGAKDINYCNLFLISSSQYFMIAQYENNMPKIIKNWDKQPNIKNFEYNILKIEKIGNLVYYSINNQIVFNHAFENYYGHIHGFAIQNSMEVEIDYIKVNSTPEKIELADFKTQGEPIKLNSRINTPYTEIAPIISADGKTLYFCRANHPSNIGKKDDEGDIWFCQKQNNEWSEAINIGKPINNKGVNALISISPDNNTIYLEGLYYRDGSHKSEQGISFSTRKADGWTIPQQIKIKNFYNKNIYESYFMSADQQILLMSIERDDSFGNLDLYVSFRQENGEFTEPKNLGPQINTYASEGTPFLALDGKTLYFSSEGHPGYGSKDIFISKRIDDSWTNWTKPLNLGPKINTNNWETYFSLSAKGDTAFFVRSDGTFGQEDIYMIALNLPTKPEPVVLVKGYVLDIETNKPLECQIEYYDLENNKKAGIAHSNPQDGSYSIVLPYGKNYGITAISEGYLSIKENLNLKKVNVYKEINKNIYMAKIKIGQTIKLNNIFFEQASDKIMKESYPELEELVKLMNNNKTLEIELHGHTDNRGNPQVLFELSQKRVNAIKEYLVNNGIDSTRIKTKAWGGKMPINKDESEEEHAKNRRVEIKILKL